MKSIKKISLLVLIAGIAIVASSVAPLLADRSGDQTAFGPACCRYSNECPGSETCGKTTGCSEGAPYHCTGGATEEEQ